MIVTVKEDDLTGAMETHRCSVCDGRLWPPFLIWHGSSLALCKTCSLKVKRGLIADIVHLSAISELHQLGYLDQTLRRRSRHDLSREHQEMQKKTTSWDKKAS